MTTLRKSSPITLLLSSTHLQWYMCGCPISATRQLRRVLRGTPLTFKASNMPLSQSKMLILPIKATNSGQSGAQLTFRSWVMHLNTAIQLYHHISYMRNRTECLMEFYGRIEGSYLSTQFISSFLRTKRIGEQALGEWPVHGAFNNTIDIMYYDLNFQDLHLISWIFQNWSTSNELKQTIWAALVNHGNPNKSALKRRTKENKQCTW